MTPARGNMPVSVECFGHRPPRQESASNRGIRRGYLRLFSGVVLRADHPGRVARLIRDGWHDTCRLAGFLRGHPTRTVATVDG
jgi:hypothetical protein